MSKYYTDDNLIQLNIKDVLPNYDQPRSIFNEKALLELAQSISEHGVVEPILVERAEAAGFYKIIAGERRYRAAQMIGLGKIPAIIISGTQEELREIAIIENSHRQQLNPMEEAEAIKLLIDKTGLTQEMAASKLSRSRSAIANLLRLLTLPLDVQALIREGKLSQGHARVLLSIKNEKLMASLAYKCVEEKWSVRALTQELEKAEKKKTEKAKPKQKVKISPELRDMVMDMERVFQTPVELKGDDKKGKLIIEYNNLDELNRIYDAIQEMRRKSIDG